MIQPISHASNVLRLCERRLPPAETAAGTAVAGIPVIGTVAHSVQSHLHAVPTDWLVTTCTAQYSFGDYMYRTGQLW